MFFLSGKFNFLVRKWEFLEGKDRFSVVCLMSAFLPARPLGSRSSPSTVDTSLSGLHIQGWRWRKYAMFIHSLRWSLSKFSLKAVWEGYKSQILVLQILSRYLDPMHQTWQMRTTIGSEYEIERWDSRRITLLPGEILDYLYTSLNRIFTVETWHGMEL